MTYAFHLVLYIFFEWSVGRSVMGPVHVSTRLTTEPTRVHVLTTQLFKQLLLLESRLEESNWSVLGVLLELDPYSSQPLRLWLLTWIAKRDPTSCDYSRYYYQVACVVRTKKKQMHVFVPINSYILFTLQQIFILFASRKRFLILSLANKTT